MKSRSERSAALPLFTQAAALILMLPLIAVSGAILMGQAIPELPVVLAVVGLVACRALRGLLPARKGAIDELLLLLIEYVRSKRA